VVGARHRQQGARRVGGAAQGVEVARVVDEGGQLPAAIGQRHGLGHDGQAQGRQRPDLVLGQPELLVQVGLADRREVVDARDRQAGGHGGMLEMEGGEVRPRGPAGEDDRSADPARRSVRGEPVEGGPDLGDDAGEARLGCQGVARHRHRPAGRVRARREAREIGPGVALPVAAVDEDEAGGLRVRHRVEVEGRTLPRGVGDVEPGRMRGPVRRGGGVAGRDLRGAVGHARVVVVAGAPGGEVQGVPAAARVRRGRVVEGEGGHRRHLRPRSPEAGSASRPRSASPRAGRRPAAAGGRRSPAYPRCRAAGSGRDRRAAPTRRPRSRP
jgi:hypothetical protein